MRCILRHFDVLRDAGDWTFASFKPRGEEGEKQYAWARVRKEERQVILWRPNEDKFKVLVEEGRLPGMVDGSVVVLDTLAPDHLDLIRSETHGVLFVWDKPFVLLKAGK